MSEYDINKIIELLTSIDEKLSKFIELDEQRSCNVRTEDLLSDIQEMLIRNDKAKGFPVDGVKPFPQPDAPLCDPYRPADPTTWPKIACTNEQSGKPV